MKKTDNTPKYQSKSLGVSSTLPTRRQVVKGLSFGAGSLAFGAGLPGTAIAAGGTLTVAIPDNPTTLDPIMQANHDAMVVTQTIFENLIQVDVNGNLRPQLAVALPSISDNRLEYVFTLRENVKFQNGDPFSAEDVKYSFDYVLDPVNGALRRPLFDRISEIIVEGPTRVRFRLREPYRPWLYYMTKYMGIFPKGSRERYDAEVFKNAPAGLGTGPGKFVEWRQNDRVVMDKNPLYWSKDIPAWDRVDVRIIPDDGSRVAYLETGKVDIISDPSPREFDKLKSMKGIEAASRPTLGGWFFLITNTRKPPFDDTNFRRAIACAIDRKMIASNIYYGLVEPATIPAPPGSWWFDEKANTINRYNMERAKHFLRHSKYSSGAEFDMLVTDQPYLLDVKDAAVVVQAELAELGIKVNIRTTDHDILLQRARHGDIVSALQVWMSPGEPSYMIDIIYGKDNVFSKSTNYNNKAAWALIDDTYHYTDKDMLKPLFSRLLTQLAEDSPNVWLGFVKASNAWRSDVKGFEVNQGLTMRLRNVSKS